MDNQHACRYSIIRRPQAPVFYLGSQPGLLVWFRGVWPVSMWVFVHAVCIESWLSVKLAEVGGLSHVQPSCPNASLPPDHQHHTVRLPYKAGDHPLDNDVVCAHLSDTLSRAAGAVKYENGGTLTKKMIYDN